MLARAGIFTFLPLLAVLASCGPVPLEQAERTCLRDADLAQRPRGSIAIGGGSGGAFGRIEMEVSDDYLMRRDPSDVYNRCVLSRSGQMPTRPLDDQLGWRG
ncbi:hypothetical protein H4P12_09720 [Paracoccus sp. 11-3]|uniref:Lipoprotein n=1 Tax=Paracoccus amoyensis TaxID=2760093 RepID=A0A926GGR5_9RHOB|nr:hypothetical protein [Paracoccus amoyensis]MBC9246989.1 hypothetical protein [Paracoccus amoyensis]